MLILQIFSLLITATGALLGTLWDFRKDGRVTRVGIAAVILVVAGFIASATILLVKDQQQRRAESRADEQRRRANRLEETLVRTQFKEKTARQLTLSVSFRRPRSGDSAFVTFVETKHGTYAFLIPPGYPRRARTFKAKAGIVEGRRRQLARRFFKDRTLWFSGRVDNGRFRRLSHSDITYSWVGDRSGVIDKRVSISITRRELRRKEWFIDVAADIEQVQLYGVVSDRRDAVRARGLHQVVNSVAEVRLLVDDFPVELVTKPTFSQGLIIARPEGTSLASGEYVEGQFFEGNPPWERLVSAAGSGKNPGSVVARNQQKEERDQIVRQN
jgi:hypothetical protein